jgi:hypothetical protein
MPYIVTPGIQTTDAGTNFDATACADIGEARSAILTELGDRGYIDGPEHALCGAVADLSEASGGTIGPLPGGYVIEVQAVTWDELGELTGRPYLAVNARPGCGAAEVARAALLDAYNA